ncbi:MAG: hypothetical protein LBB77_09805 [Treponema sp.]|nr:hypothetical protein [Treponema sp.]
MPRSAYPNCLACLHFKVSWDPALPRSCGLFGFKCLDLPSVEVFKSTGKHCPAFRERETRK